MAEHDRLEIRSSNCLASFQRIDRSGRCVKPDLSISGMHLVLKSHKLGRLILLISRMGGSEAALDSLQQAKILQTKRRQLRIFGLTPPG